MKICQPHGASIFHFDANILALCCYLTPLTNSSIPLVSRFVWAFPLVVYLIEKQSEFARFHAMQAFLLQTIFRFLNMMAMGPAGIFVESDGVLGMIAGVFLLVGIALRVILFVVSIYSVVKSYRYYEFELPLLGMLTRKFFKPLSQ